MYYFLSDSCTKIGLENWTSCLLYPNVQEGKDYVLVNHTVWDMLKRTFGGGPEIQFFLNNNNSVPGMAEQTNEKNFIYHQPYMYGYPDKSPEYIDVKLDLKDHSKADSTIEIPLRLLVSRTMTPKSLLYYIACKMSVEVSRLSLQIMSSDNSYEPTTLD
jgi:hypothetical protein